VIAVLEDRAAAQKLAELHSGRLSTRHTIFNTPSRSATVWNPHAR
jgi:hypothetical protein